MNPTMIAIGAGIAAMIVGVVVLLPYLSQGQQQQQQNGQMIIQELAVGLSSVKVSSEDATTATVEVTFSVFNPTRTTVILEHIKYTLYADGTRVGDSMIGESLEGIVAGSGRTNYILPNTQLLLKDTIKVTKTRGLEGVWDTLMAGGVRWEVDGVYSVTGWQEKQFNAAK